MNHTPEPWEQLGNNGVHKTISRHYAICIATTDGDNRKANAERIVACVNALAGIPEPQAMAHALDLIRQAVWCLERQDRPATALVVANRLKSLWEQAKQVSYQPLTTDPVTDQ